MSGSKDEGWVWQEPLLCPHPQDCHLPQRWASTGFSVQGGGGSTQGQQGNLGPAGNIPAPAVYESRHLPAVAMGISREEGTEAVLPVPLL